MLEHSWSRMGVALLLAAGLAGCNGKPEDTGEASQAAAVTTPAPPYPAWTGPLLGKPLAQVSRGVAVCKGQIDTVAAKHTGAHPGSEIEGWAWNEKDAKPMAKVIFVDQANRIVGGATEGNPRPDVKSSLPEVKTEAVGWKGVAGPTSGSVTAVGLTDNDASCVLSTIAL